MFSHNVWLISRAYDRAAIKFRGLDADINFNVSDYEDDFKQVFCVPIVVWLIQSSDWSCITYLLVCADEELNEGRVCAHTSSSEHRVLQR